MDANGPSLLSLQRPWSVCFYAPRDGAGCTTTLLNTVLNFGGPFPAFVLDLNLPCPGVDSFARFGPAVRAQPGFMEYVREWRETGDAPDLNKFVYWPKLDLAERRVSVVGLGEPILSLYEVAMLWHRILAILGVRDRFEADSLPPSDQLPEDVVAEISQLKEHYELAGLKWKGLSRFDSYLPSNRDEASRSNSALADHGVPQPVAAWVYLRLHGFQVDPPYPTRSRHHWIAWPRHPARTPASPLEGPLCVMRAGLLDKRYARDLCCWDWRHLGGLEEPGWILLDLQVAAARRFGCSWMFVDAPAGMFEAAGFATRMIADAAVLVTDPSERSLEVLRPVVEVLRAREATEGISVPRLYVFSKVFITEEDRFDPTAVRRVRKWLRDTDPSVNLHYLQARILPPPVASEEWEEDLHTYDAVLVPARTAVAQPHKPDSYLFVCKDHSGLQEPSHAAAYLIIARWVARSRAWGLDQRLWRRWRYAICRRLVELLNADAVSEWQFARALADKEFRTWLGSMPDEVLRTLRDDRRLRIRDALAEEAALRRARG